MNAAPLARLLHGISVLLGSALLLAGCDDPDAQGAGGVTASEARALNEAAEMLDTRPGAPPPPVTQ